jgi:hypothetical protein
MLFLTAWQLAFLPARERVSSADEGQATFVPTMVHSSFPFLAKLSCLLAPGCSHMEMEITSELGAIDASRPTFRIILHEAIHR